MSPTQHSDDDGIALHIETLSDADDRLVLHARGEIDGADIEYLRRGLATAIRQGAPQIVLDLNAVTYLGSAGLACMVLASLDARTAGSTLYVVSDRPAVVRPIRIAGLADILHLQPRIRDIDPPGAA